MKLRSGFSTEMEVNNGQMALNTRENGCQEKWMEKAPSLKQTWSKENQKYRHIKASLNSERNTGSVNSFGQMGQFIRDHGVTTRSKDQESTIGQMEDAMLEIGSKVIHTVRESTNQRTTKHTKGPSLTERSMAKVPALGQTAKSIQEAGRTANNTGTGHSPKQMELAGMESGCKVLAQNG